jgi:AAA15 family ATPase/GTPase
MIVDFTIKNFRSFKDKTIFSLEASGAKGKSENVSKVTLKNGKKIRLLKTAVIYGANASGKSNLIRAFWTLRKLVSSSYLFDVNDEIELAEPFELDRSSKELPIEFNLNFIGWDKQQYIYFISLSKKDGIIEETLKYYPEKTAKIIFKRKGRKIISKDESFFIDMNNLKTINPKRLFLSELGNSGNEYWEDLRNYFIIGNVVLNTSANSGMRQSMTRRGLKIFESQSEEIVEIKKKLINLLKLSDLGIKDLELVEESESEETSNNIFNESEEIYSKPQKQKRFKTIHDIYDGDKIIGNKEFDLFRNASTGTIALFGLCAEILVSLDFERGRPNWIDELDNSLHPYLCKFIVKLFNHPESNPFNAQLIFATHETTLLERNNFRKDQIWIASKDKYGCSKLYSVYDLDIDGLRDDIPFDKWYLSGKFGGLPKIKEFDFIFKRFSDQ